MNAREQAAFNAGIEAARQMAMTAAVSLEIRDDAREVRQQAAAAALLGLADGMKLLLQGAAARADFATLDGSAAGAGTSMHEV